MQACKVREIEKEWLSSDEAKRYLGVSDGFLRAIRNDGLVRVSRVRNKWFYEKASIDRMLQGHRVV